MRVIEVNEGTKVSYEVIGNKIFFNDELMLNLEKYERDDDQLIDICENENFALTTGLGRKYVAQIEIPAREYKEVIEADEDSKSGTEEKKTKVPLAFNINKITLSLWGQE